MSAGNSMMTSSQFNGAHHSLAGPGSMVLNLENSMPEKNYRMDYNYNKQDSSFSPQ
jgi:hypothetical protein